ncbi:MAG TPA: response regulator [Candidatus Nitrosocosmicus sp.]|nr:response regulator [Candidatus Nitrosocosmicus sp.]
MQLQKLQNKHKKQEQLRDLKRNKRGTILLVDDEPDSCLVYQLVLEEVGFVCISYTDSVKALKEFKAYFYDLILLDIKMPTLNGFELGKKIKEVDSAIEIIFITALMEHYRNVLDQQSYSQLINNTTTYIQKPVENEELVKTITQILRTGNAD